MVLLFIGREIREQLDEHVAQLYADLDGGLSHLAWLLPGWLPLPSFRSAVCELQMLYLLSFLSTVVTYILCQIQININTIQEA